MDSAFFNRLIHLVDGNPQRSKRMFGLGGIALWELWQRICDEAKTEALKQAQRSDRKRRTGGGRPYAADVLCRLLVSLIYLRQHWTMDAIAQSIDCAESTVHNYIHEMLPYIRTQLPASLLEQWQQDCPSVERVELETWLTEIPEGWMLVDTWEQPIPRPEDDKVQEDYYSGKKAQHTRKNQLITLPKGIDLVDVVIGEKGPRSDSKLLEQTQAGLPEDIKFIGDKAYVGRANTKTPKKKPPKGTLTLEQKASNRQISQKRVFVEHVIRVVKIFRVAKEVFRMRNKMYEEVIGCVCGLVRLRVQYV
jgi:DDE superfamily endonuclease/Helix-turn-helix of DDE superfamily endonuclease